MQFTGIILIFGKRAGYWQRHLDTVPLRIIDAYQNQLVEYIHILDKFGNGLYTHDVADMIR